MTTVRALVRVYVLEDANCIQSHLLPLLMNLLRLLLMSTLVIGNLRWPDERRNEPWREQAALYGAATVPLLLLPLLLPAPSSVCTQRSTATLLRANGRQCVIGQRVVSFCRLIAAGIGLVRAELTSSKRTASCGARAVAAATPPTPPPPPPPSPPPPPPLLLLPCSSSSVSGTALTPSSTGRCSW
jgi:hypothetical protein